MANYELGRIGLNLRGSYDAAMTYQRLDTVTYNGSSYVALENCSGILPSDTERWMMLAQGGSRTGCTGWRCNHPADEHAGWSRVYLRSGMQYSLYDSPGHRAIKC